MPTCGTKFYRFDGARKKLYCEDFSVDEKKTIIGALRPGGAAGRPAEKHRGEPIEDRDNQITFSALDQAAPLDKGKMGPRLREAQGDKGNSRALIPAFSIQLGGSTSINVTRPGIDKAYGVRKLHETLGIAVADMIFVGDAIFPGGNDYPAKQSGAGSIRVRDPHETKRVVEAICVCLETGDSHRQIAS